ncbi:putative nuclease HARBI1 [Spodoptera frugiperda]|uniref:Nuclease HARBI1 n=1 Tax=Spodoptera frugiperda TaxID=7108 RepID=A0A9R0DK47_SPOFR|nr:putative nuclease HARBI1 [Spodoptera frugiperda]
MNVCQQSVSRIIAQVSTLLANKMKDFVKFPSTESEISTVKQTFYEIAHFPGVIGCIDCTHIKIRSPGGQSSEVYRNRKGYFSINVQAVTGPNLEFFDLVARWPGSTHDSFIYKSSAIKQRLNTSILKGIILGNSGYAVSSVLLTPFLSPHTNPQENYNKSHIKTRNTVERCFGVWKRRFPCLQVGMGVKVETVVAVICACATLHNIALSVDDVMPMNYYEDIDIQNDDVAVAVSGENTNSNGFTVRQSLVDRFFQ